MKQILIIRHSKSTWKGKDIRDIDRPLKISGIEDGYRVARKLKELDLPIDWMITSPATRAHHTCMIFARELEFPTSRIKIAEDLYFGDPRDILQCIVEDENAEVIALFGHDPTFTNLLNRLTGEEFEKISTSGVVQVAFDIDDWADISSQKGKIVAYLQPKTPVLNESK